MENEKLNKASQAFKSLQLPSMVPRSLAVYFGPGIILMMTGIGTSHLITAPIAGTRFAYALLWCIPICLHIQVLRLRNGVPVYQRHGQEYG